LGLGFGVRVSDMVFGFLGMQLQVHAGSLQSSGLGFGSGVQVIGLWLPGLGFRDYSLGLMQAPRYAVAVSCGGPCRV